MRTELLMSLVSIASLLLVQACNSSGGGGGGGTPAPDNGQSSEATITSLVITVSGTDHTIDFDSSMEATVDYPYSLTALTSVIVQAITISADATSDHGTGATINVENDKITITVTARDGITSQTYTINFNFVQAQPNTEADIASLTVNVSGVGHTISFDANRQATVNYPYSTTALTNVIVQAITISADAASDHGTGATINVENGKITITVTAQDGTTSQTYTINLVQAQPNTEADIASLTVNISGVGHTISFDANRQATVNYPYSTTALTNVIVQAITISADATSDYDAGAILTLSDDKVTITVTAQDGTTSQTYTINLVMAANSEADITSLVLTVLGADQTIDFGDKAEVTEYYPYSGSDLLSVMIKSISLSADATSDYDAGAILTLSDDKVTITVTAQDGTTSQTYTINLVASTNTEADITSLVLTVLGADQTIDFDANRQASAYYPLGDSTPDSVRITSIVMSTGATASVANDQTVDLADDKITITVTAQYGNTVQTYNITFVQTLPTLRGILDSTIGGTSGVPHNLSEYDELSQTVLKPYNANATLVARYVTIDGGAEPQGGLSWSDALPANQLKKTLDDISDAGADKVYLILVASGNTANASYDAGSAMKMKNHVAIIGGWDAIGGWGRSGTTVLSGGGSRRVFNNDYNNSLNSLNSTAMLYGLTIAAGSSTSNGGGMRNSYSSPSMINITLSANKATNSGGAIYNDNFSSPTMNNITLSANEASDGGGIYNNNSSPSMINITLSANKATNSGGAIYNDNFSSPTMNNITLSANEASDGGGIYNKNSSSPSMSNITLSANSATNSGGAIYNSNSSPSMSNITLSANKATNSGGAIYNSNSSPSMSNITLSANEANSGGAIYNSNSSPSMSNITLSANEARSGGAIYNTNSSLTLINATFAGNKVTGNGGGIYITNRKATTIVGSIFWGNTATNGANGAQIYMNEATGDPITLAYSVIQGGAPAQITTSTKLVTDNPSLADLTTGTGSSLATMAISTSSSAVNKGVYVRRNGDNFYYSTDNDNWYSGFDSSGLTDSTSDASAEAEGSIDVTVTDATGTARSDRPDAGAYEAR